MKKIAVFLLIILTAPVISVAQSATSTSDGSNESTSVRRERIRGWRDQSSELQQKINSLSTTSVVTLPIPVLFGVSLKNISPNFGDPRDGGARTHEGEDIMAIKGTPIVSPTPAIVLRTGTGATEGNYVYTANPGGETFVYMHLDRIGEGLTSGVLLGTGSLIGYVGNTGNASGGGAHLHFEIHDSSRNSIDPFPRLTKEFSVSEKISYVSKILNQTSDPDLMSNFLVTNFRSTFVEALNQNISLPEIINNSLSSLSNPPTSGVSLPTGDLTIGSTGKDVINLQKYLILKSTGIFAVRLSKAGATGYFGSLTQSALREYQIAMNISPADGYYGFVSRASVLAGIAASSSGQGTPTSSPTSLVSFNRNLYKGLNGEDVRNLQKFLNGHGYPVAFGGPGSLGNETSYFGSATLASVIKFQIAYGLSPSVGFVGPLTRAKIAGLI